MSLQSTNKNFKVTFSGKWYEYIAGGILLGILGNTLSQYETLPFFVIAPLISIAALYFFFMGLFLVGKNVYRSFKK